MLVMRRSLPARLWPKSAIVGATSPSRLRDRTRFRIADSDAFLRPYREWTARSCAVKRRFRRTTTLTGTPCARALELGDALTLNTGKILVVDDHPDAADTTADLLRMCGAWEVQVAYNGLQAVEAARAFFSSGRGAGHQHAGDGRL